MWKLEIQFKNHRQNKLVANKIFNSLISYFNYVSSDLTPYPNPPLFVWVNLVRIRSNPEVALLGLLQMIWFSDQSSEKRKGTIYRRCSHNIRIGIWISTKWVTLIGCIMQFLEIIIIYNTSNYVYEWKYIRTIFFLFPFVEFTGW